MLLQFFLNGIVSGALIAIMAIGFWFIYRATNLFHIAHGAVYTAAVYIFYSLYISKGIPLFLSLLIAIGSTALLGLGMYYVVYRPLEKKTASSGVTFISSLAIYILMVNLIALIYGNETKVLSEDLSESLGFGDIVITLIQGYQLLALVALSIGSYIFVSKTKTGRSIRAIGENPLLFKALGLNEKMVKSLVFIIGSAIAGVASILMGLDVGIDPQVGMIALLNAVVAVIIGGTKKLEGAVLGAFLIGILQNLITWKFSARWESAVTFLLLAVVLLYKSGGILSTRKRVEEA